MKRTAVMIAVTALIASVAGTALAAIPSVQTTWAEWLQERLPGKELIHGVLVGPHAVAVTDARLAGGGPVGAEVGGVAVTLRRDPDGGVRAVRDDDGAELQVLAAYWFAWSGFHPNTIVVD